MGIYEFNILPEHEQYDIVFTEGQFVDTVTDGVTKYVLYSLSYFWIEIEYNAPKNKINGVCSFVSGEKLNRYSNVSNKF
jgi:hypothetical protein